MFTAKEAEKNGVPRWKLATRAKSGELVRLSRGVYEKSGDESRVSIPEIAILAKKGTSFVVALQSALLIHNLTTAVPHELTIALKRGARIPKVDFPLRVVRLGEIPRAAGVVEMEIDGIRFNVYSPAKTVADMFKFRTTVGMDLAIEALREGLGGGSVSVDDLLRFAAIDRVAKVIMPYVEGYFG